MILFFLSLVFKYDCFILRCYWIFKIVYTCKTSEFAIESRINSIGEFWGVKRWGIRTNKIIEVYKTMYKNLISTWKRVLYTKKINLLKFIRWEAKNGHAVASVSLLLCKEEAPAVQCKSGNADLASPLKSLTAPGTPPAVTFIKHIILIYRHFLIHRSYLYA